MKPINIRMKTDETGIIEVKIEDDKNNTLFDGGFTADDLIRGLVIVLNSRKELKNRIKVN